MHLARTALLLVAFYLLISAATALVGEGGWP